MSEQVLEQSKISQEMRAKILSLEEKLGKLPGAKFGDDAFPLKHTFVDGMYIREIFMPKGSLLTSKIHKLAHPYFIIEGEVSVLTEKGVQRIKAPFAGITKPGTKRVIYIHEDCVWITCHSNPDNGKDLLKIEERVIAKTFDELPGNIIETLGEVLKLEKENDNGNEVKKLD
jgi:hypothetical protein